VHEATLDDGVLSSYANALVIGASLCVVAGLLAGEVRSTDRSGTDPDPAGSGATGTTA
jgi:hypothetical protein